MASDDNPNRKIELFIVKQYDMKRDPHFHMIIRDNGRGKSFFLVIHKSKDVYFPLTYTLSHALIDRFSRVFH